MSETLIYQHQDYELSCSAKALDGGRFEPVLVIVKKVWPTRSRQIAVERGEFTRASDAIEAAHAQGLAWISNYG